VDWVRVTREVDRVTTDSTLGVPPDVLTEATVPTRYWHRLEDGRVQCDVCPRACRLHEGQRGLCFVRARQDDAIVSTTYGRSSGFCVDPIEKKPLFHFLPGTPVLSFGTAGCNLACRYCQNWDISKSREIDTLADAASPEGIADAALRLGCRSVAATYNDPVVFLEYATDVAQACHAQGLRAVAVTAGYVCAEPRAELFDAMDAVNVDLKSFREDFYHRLCAGHLQPVLETIEYLVHETDVWVELTTLLIPGHNDSEEDVRSLVDWVLEHLGPDVPLHFSGFHPDYKMRLVQPTPSSTLRQARQLALAAGLNYAYTGNVHDPSGSSTLCPGCSEVVLARDWYDITGCHLSSGSGGTGTCSRCGSAVAGVYDGPVGTWGTRRLPVRLAERNAS
jgi:pyruvate formate lyase activating enzyme